MLQNCRTQQTSSNRRISHTIINKTNSNKSNQIFRTAINITMPPNPQISHTTINKTKQQQIAPNSNSRSHKIFNITRNSKKLQTDPQNGVVKVSNLWPRSCKRNGLRSRGGVVCLVSISEGDRDGGVYCYFYVLGWLWDGERYVVDPQEIFGHAYSNRVCILRSLFFIFYFFKDTSIVFFFNIYIFHSSLSNFAL